MSYDEESYQIVVNRDESLETMIKAGNFDWVHKDINAENFPFKGSGLMQQEVLLVRLGRGSHLPLRDVFWEMNDKYERWQPGDFAELLAWGAQHKEKPGWDPVFAFNSTWKNGSQLLCPYIEETNNRWSVGLCRLDKRWWYHCRYLLVRKR